MSSRKGRGFQLNMGINAGNFVFFHVWCSSTSETVKVKVKQLITFYGFMINSLYISLLFITLQALRNASYVNYK